MGCMYCMCPGKLACFSTCYERAGIIWTNRLAPNRLPAAVNAAVWRRVQGAGRPRLCKEELVRVEKHTRVNVTVAVADATHQWHQPLLGMGSLSGLFRGGAGG